MTKAAKIRSFDPNRPGDANAQVYGLPFTPDEADIVLVPVPWEVTTSYRVGPGPSSTPVPKWTFFIPSSRTCGSAASPWTRSPQR